MKKCMLVLTGIVFCATQALAGGLPESKPELKPQLKKTTAEPSSSDMQKQFDELSKKLNDAIDQLNDTKATVNRQSAEINRLKNELASRGIADEGIEALPEGYEPAFQVLPPRQKKGQFFGFGELLFVKPRTFGPTVGIDENAGNRPDGELEMLEYDYELSYKVGGGYILPNDWGKFSCTFWHYEDDTDAHFSPEYYDGNTAAFRVIPQSYFPELVNLDFTSVSTYARSSLEFNQIDLEYTKPFRIMRNLDFTAGIGPRIVWIDNKSYFEYYNPNGGSSQWLHVEQPFDATLAGPRISGEARVYLPYDFQVFAQAAGALLLGHYDTSMDYTVSNGATNRIKVEDTLMVPNIEATLGVSYAPCIWDGNVIFTAGYQFMMYPGLWKGFYGPEDLAFDGALTKVELRY